MRIGCLGGLVSALVGKLLTLLRKVTGNGRSAS